MVFHRYTSGRIVFILFMGISIYRLSDFIKEGCGQCKCELMQLLYPTFVSIYLDLIARGVSAVGKTKVTLKRPLIFVHLFMKPNRSTVILPIS